MAPSTGRAANADTASGTDEELPSVEGDDLDDDVPEEIDLTAGEPASIGLSPREFAPVHRGGAGGRQLSRAGAAAERTARRHSVTVSLPLVGTVSLPATDELAFLGGIGVLAVAGVIEWPVAIAVAAGHALAASHRNKAVEEFGAALESA